MAVGSFAGFNQTTGSNNIYLGANVMGVASEANTMYLGQVGTQTTTFIAGTRGVTTVNANAIPVLIDSRTAGHRVLLPAREAEHPHDGRGVPGLAGATSRHLRVHRASGRRAAAIWSHCGRSR